MKEWEQFLSNLNKELGPAVVDRWLKTLRIIRFDAANLYLEAQDPMQVVWFEEHIRPRIKQGFFNENHRSIRVHITKENLPPITSLKPTMNWNVSFVSDPIDPFCTLDSFFVTKDNLMSHKILLEWGSSGLSTFNPIFLYGPKGSGKTHLLMSAADLCNKLKKQYLFVSADTFTEHVVQAIRASRMQEFRKLYREIDVLIIDDVDKLAKRIATQEEFFHTFNTLHLQNKQIILSSNTPPSRLTDIEFRLISRFEWGLPIGVGMVDSHKILELKAKNWKFALTEELSTFLLTHFTRDPITAMQALVLRTKGPDVPSALMAKQILGDLIRKEEEKSLTPEKIIKSLAHHFGITAEDIVGKSQTREFAFPRQVAMYLCREKIQMPFQGIGKIFGRDHSTVMSSVKQIEQAIEKKENNVLEAILVASQKDQA